jgi:hypothetical protein
MLSPELLGATQMIRWMLALGTIGYALAIAVSG